MPNANLDRAYTLRGKTYGPGEDVEIPDELHDILSEKGILENDVELNNRLGPDLADTLREHGFADVNTVRGAEDDELLAIPGVGTKRVEIIRGAVGKEGDEGNNPEEE